MNLLGLPAQKKRPRGGLLERSGNRLRWPVAQVSHHRDTPANSYVAYIIVCTDTAAVAVFSDELGDNQSRSLDPNYFIHGFEAELTPFLQLDIEGDSFDEDQGSTSEISAFLDTVYDFSKRRKEDHAIDVIFEYINNLLVEGHFETCDRILGEVDIARIPTVLMVSFLTITAAAKAKLKNRRRFYKLVERVVARERGAKATQRLLDGLD